MQGGPCSSAHALATCFVTDDRLPIATGLEAWCVLHSIKHQDSSAVLTATDHLQGDRSRVGSEDGGNPQGNHAKLEALEKQLRVR